MDTLHTAPLDSKKNKGGNSHNKLKTKTILTCLALTGAIAFVGFNAYKLTVKFVNAWPAIAFAYQYPELVKPLKEQFNTESMALKDSLIKRQSLISPVVGQELPKE